MFFSLSCFLVQLGDDVAGFVCDRYNGHVCSPSASCFGNKQKQTHQHTHTQTARFLTMRKSCCNACVSAEDDNKDDSESLQRRSFSRQNKIVIL